MTVERGLFFADNVDLLIERGRMLMQLLIAFVLLFALADFAWAGDRRNVLFLLKGAMVVCAGTGFYLLGARKSFRWVASIAVAVVAATTVLVGLQSLIVGDPLAVTAIVSASLFTAAFLPWNLAGQAVLVVVFVAVVAGNAAWIGAGYEHVLALGSCLASLVVAHSQERHRLSLWRAQRALVARDEALAAEDEIDAALAEVGRTLIAFLGSDALLERLCEVTSRVLRTDYSRTARWVAADDAYTQVAAYGDPPEQEAILRSVKVPRTVVADLLARIEGGEILEMVVGVDSHPYSAQLRKLGIVAALYIPLRRREEVYGVLIAGFRKPGMRFTTRQKRIAQGIAHLASVALDNAGLCEELVRAKDSAESATRRKSEFLAAMSHEIRTPMNGVLGMAELLAGTELNGQQKGFLDVIQQSGRNLLAIINDILDLSKIEANKLDLDLRPVNVREVIDQVVALLRPQAEEKKLALTCDVNAEVPPWLETDPARLRQILLNLVGNALKFTDSGGVHVTARIHRARLEVAVQDTGIGIAPEQQAMLFEAFQQLGASRTRRYGGTGLGLAISRRLAQMLGGEMWLRSEPGKGSTFSFSIAAPAVQLRSGIAPGSEQLVEVPPAEIAPLRILVVEDVKVNQLVIAEMLKRLGSVPDVVSNGLEAIEAVHRKRYDVVLMDVIMPEMDGLTATRRIVAEIPAEQRPRIVALTAAATSRERACCFEAGMDDYLSKPVGSGELRQVLSRTRHDRTKPAASFA